MATLINYTLPHVTQRINEILSDPRFGGLMEVTDEDRNLYQGARNVTELCSILNVIQEAMRGCWEWPYLQTWGHGGQYDGDPSVYSWGPEGILVAGNGLRDHHGVCQYLQVAEREDKPVEVDAEVTVEPYGGAACRVRVAGTSLVWDVDEVVAEVVANDVRELLYESEGEATIVDLQQHALRSVENWNRGERVYYDLAPQGSELVVVAGPRGVDIATIQDTDDLPAGCRLIGDDEWNTAPRPEVDASV